MWRDVVVVMCSPWAWAIFGGPAFAMGRHFTR